LAKKILYTSFTLGILMGLSRLVQGAHFLSHVLWSAWFAWALTIALAALLRVPLSAEKPAV
jgi:membrane-associated PAP2 superfamily phosphatase